MVLNQETEHIYRYPWDIVSRAFWRKYPNPRLQYVVRMDIVSRFIDNGGRLCTARVAKCVERGMPEWVESILGRYWYVYEETICDPVAKTLELKSTNLTFRTVTTIDEMCLYRQQAAPDDSMTHTKYSQDSRIAFFIPLVSDQLERLSLNRGQENAVKGLSSMEDLCKRILDGETFPDASQ